LAKTLYVNIYKIHSFKIAEHYNPSLRTLYAHFSLNNHHSPSAFIKCHIFLQSWLSICLLFVSFFGGDEDAHNFQCEVTRVRESFLSDAKLLKW